MILKTDKIAIKELKSGERKSPASDKIVIRPTLSDELWTCFLSLPFLGYSQILSKVKTIE